MCGQVFGSQLLYVAASPVKLLPHLCHRMAVLWGHLSQGDESLMT